jgi:hypothetical protein
VQTKSRRERPNYGKTLDVTGLITGITLDISNDPTIQMEGTNQFLPVQARFDKSYSVRISSLSKGQQITVRCSSVDTVLSSPVLDKCTFP